MTAHVLDIAMIFEELAPRALSTGRIALRLPGPVVFDVGGERGGTWTIDLSGDLPSCTRGAAPGAVCRIRGQAGDFDRVLGGQATLEDLFYDGALEVSGDMSVAASIPPLFEDLVSEAESGVARLMAPMTAEQFLAEYWPGRLAVAHGPRSRLGTIASIPELEDVGTLLASWSGPVRVFPPSEDDFMSPNVTADVAQTLYERGFTLVFGAAEQRIRRLAAPLRRLRHELGLPPSVWARCMVYANPAGGLLNPHFDENANFSIQLRGEKVWRLAPNHQVVHPTVGHLMSMPGPHPELALEMTGDFPRQMPADARVVTMTEGSVMFVPRGEWHATSTPREALSLNFTFDMPSWADVVAAALRARLLREAPWRELATGAASANRPLAEAARHQLAASIAAAASALAALAPEDVGAALRDRPVAEIDVLDLRRDWLAVLEPLGRPGDA